jgi:hypothetical protein
MAACEAHIEAYRKTHLSENGIDGELFSQFERLCKQWRLTDPGLGSDLERVVLGISQLGFPTRPEEFKRPFNWTFAFTGLLVRTPSGGKGMTGGSSPLRRKRPESSTQSWCTESRLCRM